MKKTPVVPTSFRMKMDIYEMFETYMETSDTSRNEAMNNLLRMGLEASQEIAIDEHIEKKQELTFAERAMASIENKEGGTW